MLFTKRTRYIYANETTVKDMHLKVTIAFFTVCTKVTDLTFLPML